MIFSLFMSKYGFDVLTDAIIGPVRVHVERTSSGQALAYPQFAIPAVSQVVVVDGLEVVLPMCGRSFQCVEGTRCVTESSLRFALTDAGEGVLEVLPDMPGSLPIALFF
jgi:hypothetical protein